MAFPVVLYLTRPMLIIIPYEVSDHHNTGLYGRGLYT